MSAASPKARIAVGNMLVDGVARRDAMPTFVLNALGLSVARCTAEIEEVAYLQAVAPVFRVVLLTDLPLFSMVRPLGWPVEHFVSEEHRERTMSEPRAERYVEQRIQLAREHYLDTRVVTPLELATFASEIAVAIGHPQLASVTRAFATSRNLDDAVGSGGATLEESLRSTGAALLATAEGSVRITSDQDERNAVLIVGSSGSAAAASAPDWVRTVHASFAPNSSLAFESYVYALLARRLGTRLTVAEAWRPEAMLSEQTLHDVDLAVQSRGGGFVVASAYLEGYMALTGSNALVWEQARTYAAVRRISKHFSGRNIA